MAQLVEGADFAEQASAWVRSRAPAAFCAVAIVIDHQRTVEMIWSRDTAAALVDVAVRRVVAALEPRDLLCRLADGRLWGLVTVDGPDGPDRLGQRLVTALDQTARALEKSLWTTASVGVASAQSGTRLVDLVQKAEMALFEARREGGRRYVVHR